MGDLSGKTALITGASKGIGAAIAKAMAAAGASVAVNYSSDAKGAQAVVDAIRQAGGQGLAIQGNVAKHTDVKRMFTEAASAFGPIHTLVNNAAAYDLAALEDITEGEFHRHFDVNVLGPILMAQEALKHFGPGANIINVSSAIVLTPAQHTTLYASTKAALNMVTEVLSRELGSRQIRVNSLCPGVTETEKHRVSEWDEGIVRAIKESTALRRIGLPTDIAPAAVFLASDKAAWITGNILYVSGGLR